MNFLLHLRNTFNRGPSPITLRQRLAADEKIDAAYTWLCNQRREYTHNDDVWWLRRDWTHVKGDIQSRLLLGTYQLDVLHKRHGKQGSWLIWSAADALVLRALTQVLGEEWSQDHSAHCYHVSGRGGLKAAVRAVQEHLPEYAFVFRSDVKGYYQNIEHRRLRAQLRERIQDPYILSIIDQYIGCTICDGGEFHTQTRGITRGCPLAPLLGAIYLDELDPEMEKLPVKYVRYMDDWIVLARTRWHLRRAISRCNRILAGLGLSQHPDKTYVGRSARGLDFLGYHHRPSAILGVAQVTLEKCRDKVRALCQRAVGPVKIAEYIKRWMQWCRSGVNVVDTSPMRDWLNAAFKRHGATLICLMVPSTG